MAESSFMIGIHFNVFGRYFAFHTPDFWREEHRPCLIPKWEFTDLRSIASCQTKLEHSKMFMFDWFFHFCAVYGPPYDAIEEALEDPLDVNEQHW